MQPLLISKILEQLQLKTTKYEVTKVTGGLMHSVFKLKTDQGVYAIKVLNPNVMKRSEALQNFREAERFEWLIEKHKLPIIPAFCINEQKLQAFEGQYYYIYEWFEGQSLPEHCITERHCQKIAKLLAEIHNIDKRIGKVDRKTLRIDWNFYINFAREKNEEIYKIVKENLPLLQLIQERGNRAYQNLSALIAIGHNDMDSKNVLWKNEVCRIIDLECLGYTHPHLELFDLALSWSGMESRKLDFKRFKSFIEAYFEKGNSFDFNGHVLIDCHNSRLEWLEYNIKRALMIESNNGEEVKLGQEQVVKTISYLAYYDRIRPALLACLTQR